MSTEDQQPGKVAATFGLIAGIAALVLAGCIVYAAILILF